MANNVININDFRKPKQEAIYDFSIWSELHSAEYYETKIQTLISEGIIVSGVVVMDEYDIPMIYVTPNPNYVAINTTVTFDDIIPEANNP